MKTRASQALKPFQKIRPVNRGLVHFTEDEAYAIFSQTVDKTAVEAWAKCMTDRNRRLGNAVISLEEEVIDESILVTAKFRITVDGLRNKHALITDFFTDNVREVKGEWSKGKEVTLQGVVHQFRRIDPNKPVTIKLLTEVCRFCRTVE